MSGKLVQWWHKLGPRHSKFQKHIFTLALLPGVGHILWDLQDSIRNPRQFHFMPTLILLLELLAGWMTVALLTTLMFYVASALFNLDLHVYYGIWLREIKPLLFRLSARESDVVRSYDFFRTTDNRWKHKRPCFVEREDLMRRSFWPGWVFSIVTLFGRHNITQRVEDNRGRRKWVLDVDLMDESYGIYNNDGKTFLRAEFLGRNEASQTEVVRRSKAVYDFMRPGLKPGSRWTWNEDGGVLPVRWGSGGFLPLIRYRNDYWALLFLRDRRPPIGLNVPNGASETKDEYKEVKKLMAREFCEEVVVLNGRPACDAEVFQTNFETKDQFAAFLSPEFSQKHTSLRREADGLEIRRDGSDELREVGFIETPFEAHVRFHEPNPRGFGESTVRNIIYSINPAEFGIEVVALCTFELKHSEYVLNGEYDLSREVLIRELPVLIRLRYLSDIYRSRGSLGTLLKSGDSADGKLLDEVPATQCLVFDADVAFRKARKQKIEAELKKKLPRDRRSNLEWELKHVVVDWLSRYGTAVDGVRERGLQGTGQAEQELRTLCPVTWKTLELALAHGLLRKLLKK